MSVLQTLAENRIFSRVTASGTIGYTLYILHQNVTQSNVSPELLTLMGTLSGAAATFLFMTEKDKE